MIYRLEVIVVKIVFSGFSLKVSCRFGVILVRIRVGLFGVILMR